MYEVLQYIDGKLTAGAPGRSQDINDPARGEMIGRVRLAAREDVDAAVAAAAHQADRIDVEHQHRSAAARIRFGVEHPCDTEWQLERLHALGMLGQQVAEIRGRYVRGGKAEQHGDFLLRK